MLSRKPRCNCAMSSQTRSFQHKRYPRKKRCRSIEQVFSHNLNDHLDWGNSYDADRFDKLVNEEIDEFLEEENIDALDVPCVYGNWCGPGCSGPAPPIDAVDACCRAHDNCYGRKGYFACSCDRDLVRCLAPHSGKSKAAWTMRSYFKYSPCNPWA